MPPTTNRNAEVQRRQVEILDILSRCFQLDLAFLVDVTASMDPSIAMVRSGLQTIVQMIRGVYPRVKFRVAFVGYRDYADASRLEVIGFQNIATDSDFSTWQRRIQSIRATGGGDAAEDVFSGLEAVTQLQWRSKGSRFLVHIADAPCHGLDYHGPKISDDYPAGDPRDIKQILAKLKNNLGIQVYLFAHLNNSTQMMVSKFKNAVSDGRDWLIDDMFSNIQNIPKRIASEATQVVL